MKILFESYGSLENTQSSYLPRAIAKFGIQVAIRGGDKSIYDVMDDFKPDYYVAHAFRLENAAIQYLNDEDTPSPKIIIDCLGATNENMKQLSSLLKEHNVLQYLEFVYSTEKLVSNLRTVHLPECADAELVGLDGLKFNHKIEMCNVNNVREAGTGMPATSWHNVSVSDKEVEGYDYSLPVAKLSPLLKNYEKVHIEQKGHNIPQLAYDALLSGCEVSVGCPDRGKFNDLCRRVLGDKLELDRDTSEVVKLIKEKHMPENRAKTFLSQISTNQKGLNL